MVGDPVVSLALNQDPAAPAATAMLPCPAIPLAPEKDSAATARLRVDSML